MTQPSDWLNIIIGASLSVPSISGLSPIAVGDTSGSLVFGSPTLFKNVGLYSQNTITIAVGSLSIDIEDSLNIQALAQGTTTTLASPISTGNSNGQTLLDDNSWGEIETSSISPLQVGVYSTINGTSGYLSIRVSGRAITAPSGGSVNDTWVGEWTVGFRNVGGTATVVGSLTANSGSPFYDTSMAGITLSATSSANLIIFDIAGLSGCSLIFQSKTQAFVV
jgi:hypothetical protein